MSTQVIECPSACTVTVQHEIPLLSLSVEEGIPIAFAIVAVWAIAWLCKVIARQIK